MTAGGEVKRVIPVRKSTYKGDRRDTVGQVVGPDRRGIFWRSTYAEFDEVAGTTTVVFRPLPRATVEALFGGPEGAAAAHRALAAAGKLGVAGI